MRVRFSLWAFFILIASGSPAFSEPSHPKDCSFMPRAEVQEFLGKLPENVIGWVSCGDLYPETSAFIVAKFDSLSEKKLNAFVLEHARSVDHAADSANLVWKSNQPIANRQLIVHTKAEREFPVMAHYAFVTPAEDGDSYVFIHSISDRKMQVIKPTLDFLYRRMGKREFVADFKKFSPGFAVQSIARSPASKSKCTDLTAACR